MSSSSNFDEDHPASLTPALSDGNQIDTNDSTGPMFTLFPKLPLELRRLVWQYVLPAEARIIEIFLGTLRDIVKEGPGRNQNLQDDDDPYPELFEDWPIHDLKGWHAFHPNLVPSIFFVCKEANAEVKTRFEALRSTDGFPTI
jgi:hypothetical protein